MDSSRAFASDEVDMTMSDQYSSSSSDDGRDSTQTILPGGMDLDSAHPTVLGSTGQLSPASTTTNVEIPVDSSSAPTMVNSASSSCTESWTSGNADRDENENDIRWEQGSDDVLAMTKLEPMDDEFNFEDYQPAPLTPGLPPGQNGAVQPKQKRPRGRPRKHPLTPAGAAKITKGRSKTGCITCRKRKKKCDEAKPRCMNCEKNAVVCEGYHEKQIWKSGREKAEEERLRRESLPQITLHPLFHGVETTEDKIFWKHYIQTFSNVLTVEGEAKNAFKDIILHLANLHQGLMHSLLAVSSKHIDYDAPAGSKLLQDNPATTRQALQDRSDYHHDEAMKLFHEDMANTVERSDPEYQSEEYQTILAARYGQILCLLLQTRAEGNPRGEHRLHLQAYQTLIQHSPPQDPVFYSFITEFFQYHIYADDLMWHPESMTKRLSTENWQPTPPFHTPRLLGVMDGLFNYFAQITTLRNKIRENMSTTSDPPVDYNMLFRAAEIDTAIREWAPNWPAGDSRNRVGLLYQLAMSIYLFRTTYPPSLTPCSRSGMPSTVSTPQRRASMAASVVSTQSTSLMGSQNRFSSGVTQSCPSSRNPSRTTSMHETMSNMSHLAPSPPPRRRPVHNDRRLAQYVEDSLTILETFGPSDPAQTLLLIPCMIVGIASFDCEQRERVRRAIKAVRGYTGLRNCDRVSEVLEEVWARMDGGDWVSVWDWQRVARNIGIDVLCT